MGIHDFSKCFSKTSEINISELKEVDLAVDTFITIFASSSMQHAAGNETIKVLRVKEFKFITR